MNGSGSVAGGTFLDLEHDEHHKMTYKATVTAQLDVMSLRAT